jgi:uncharacterized oligopeptide transporter (OPT) family protein
MLTARSSPVRAQAYGFGEATLENPNPLAAPQAAMMASVAKVCECVAVYTGSLSP